MADQKPGGKRARTRAALVEAAAAVIGEKGYDPVSYTHLSVLLQERGLWLAELCKETGFRFSPRLHVDLWGNRRGV